MRNLILVLFFSLVLVVSKAQEDNSYYYYYLDDKIPIDIDSSCVLIIGDDITKNGGLIQLLNNADVIYTSQAPYQNILNVKFGSENERASLLKSIKEKHQNVFLSFSYRYSKNNLLVKNEIILKPKVSTTEIEDRFKGKVRLKREKKHKTVLFEVLLGNDVLTVANEIHESGLVEWSQPNFIADRQLGNPLYSDQYYLNNTGQFGGTVGIDINAPEAWAVSTGCGVRVAVIDQGVNNHDDMSGRVVSGFDPVNSSNPGHPLVTGDNHGVACAGIIAASNNSIGIRGIAENAIIVPVRIFNGMTAYSDSDVEDAINWAWDDGEAGILSNSWGGGAYSSSIKSAIDNATTYGRGGLGTVVIACSMNNYPHTSDVAFPASLNNVIAVGAIDKHGSIWGYSQRGSTLNLVAPSGNTNGNGDVRTTDRMGAAGYSSGNYTNTFGGTSAAAPQVAGVAALMLSVNPNLTQAEVRSILEQTATDMGTPGFDNVYGYGRLNAEAAVISATGITINGPDLVCSTGSFSLAGTLSSPVSWSSSNSSILTINPSTGVATKIGNGRVTITVSIGTGCSTVKLTKKNVWVGIANFEKKLNSTIITGITSAPVTSGSTNTLELLTSSPLASTTFNKIDFYGIGNMAISISAPTSPSSSIWVNNWSTNGYRVLKLSSTNSCGTYEEDFTLYLYSLFKAVYPNPAKDFLILEFNDVSTQDRLPDTIDLISQESMKSEKTLTIQDILTDTKNLQDKKYTLDVSKLKRGIWYLHVKKGNNKPEVVRILLE